MEGSKKGRRVVVVYWKNAPGDPLEVFSSLKNFCLSYPEYSYSTLSNYLSKAKIAYETEELRVERKNVLVQPKPPARKIAPVVRRVALKEADDYERDLEYWMSKTPGERLAAVTLLVRQSLKKGERMDKARVIKGKLRS